MPPEAVSSSPLVFAIRGLPGWWHRAAVKYDHANKRCTCPVCGQVGWVWCGWFSCDGNREHVALIETGETFVKVDIS